MSDPSNIRKLLSDPNLGLLPHIDKSLKEIEVHFGDRQGSFKVEPYDLEFGECQTQMTANDVKPIVSQLVSMRFQIVGQTKDKIELLMTAAEMQNLLDAAIVDWSTRERSQYDNKPLRRPVSTIVGKLDCESGVKSKDSCSVTIYRDFELVYAATML